MAKLKYYNTKTNAWETVDSTFGTVDVKTVNGVEPDANGNIEIGIPEMPEINYPVTSVNGMTGDVVIEVGSEQVQSNLSQNDPEAPDYVKGRTHYEDVVIDISFDGNSEGMESFLATHPGFGEVQFVKISDSAPSSEEISGATTYLRASMDGQAQEEASTLENINTSDEGNAYMCDDFCIVALASGNATFDGTTYAIPSAGVWFLDLVPLYAANGVHLDEVLFTIHKSIIQQIDKKFVSDAVNSMIPLVVTFTRADEEVYQTEEWDELGENPVATVWECTADHTFSEIFDAAKSGRPVVANVNIPNKWGEYGHWLSMPLCGFYESDDDGCRACDFHIVHDYVWSDLDQRTRLPQYHLCGTQEFLDGRVGEEYWEFAENLSIIMGKGLQMRQASSNFGMKLSVAPAAAIADLTAAPTMEDFNNLLAALRTAGFLAE